MRWIKRVKEGGTAGWCVLAAPEKTVGNEEELVPCAINDILHEMIEEAKFKGKMNDVSLMQAPAEDEHEDEDAMDEDEDGA